MRLAPMVVIVAMSMLALRVTPKQSLVPVGFLIASVPFMSIPILRKRSIGNNIS